MANQWSEVYLGSVVIKGFWTTGNNKISITNRFYFCAFELRRISKKKLLDGAVSANQRFVLLKPDLVMIESNNLKSSSIIFII